MFAKSYCVGNVREVVLFPLDKKKKKKPRRNFSSALLEAWQMYVLLYFYSFFFFSSFFSSSSYQFKVKYVVHGVTKTTGDCSNFNSVQQAVAHYYSGKFRYVFFF